MRDSLIMSLSGCLRDWNERSSTRGAVRLSFGLPGYTNRVEGQVPSLNMISEFRE
jgi:hypothetical protein